MKNNLESRLLALEKASPDGNPPAIYVGVSGTATGWTWCDQDGAPPFDVRRHPGETDDELRQRAYDAATDGPPLDPLRAILFFMITGPVASGNEP